MSSSSAARSSPSASPPPVVAVPDSPAEPAAPAAKPKRGRVAVAVFAAAVALGAGGWFFAHRGFVSTDDAQLDADVVAVPSRAAGTVMKLHFVDNQPVAEGALLVELDDAPAKAKLAQAEAEVEAARASARAAEATAELSEKGAHFGKNIARASLSGAAAQVSASSGEAAEIDANLASATALRDKAKLDLERSERLVASGSVSQADADAARAAFDSADAAVRQAEARLATLRSTTSEARARVSEASARFSQANDTQAAQISEARARAAFAEARVNTAEAARDLAQLELSYTKIRAPRAGIVSKRSVTAGELVGAGQTVVMVVPDARRRGAVWVTGNFKETQLGRLRVGQPATLTVDAYGRELHGHVESFSGATGARFALLPPDNATGNFTKVVQRVPVRVLLDDAPPDLLLLPGLSVELTVNTRL